MATAYSYSSSSDDEGMIDTLLVLHCQQTHRSRSRSQNKNKRKGAKTKRKIWVEPWLLRRADQGAYANLLQELAAENPKAYKHFLRMDLCHFKHLLELVTPLIRRQDTQMRQAISPGERLACTLSYMASGMTFKYLQYLYRIPACTITTIVHETCQAIYQVLVKKYLKVPDTADEWRKIATGYERKWNFPHCIGALDGKHIAIRAPTGEGSAYFNYKHFHSIILLALVGSSYRFIYVDVGANGRSGDAGVFRDSPLYKGLENGTLNVPPAKLLPETDTTAPFVVVGDDAFPLKPYLLKPFPERHDVTKAERRVRRVFDYRLSRARRCVENAFGILSQRFGIFQRAMAFTPEKAANVTLAAVALHNCLVKERDRAYSGRLDLSVPHLASIDRQAGNRNTSEARSVRDIYCEYFNSVGSVPWQFDIPEKKQ